MKKANTVSGTYCATRREAKEPSPRLLEPPRPRPAEIQKKQLSILFGPQNPIERFWPDERYVNIYDLESLSVSLRKLEGYTQSRLEIKNGRHLRLRHHARAPTLGEARSQRLPQYTEETLRRTHCAKLERDRQF